MNLTDVLHTLSIVGPIVVGIGSIFTVLHWLVRRYTRKIDRAEAQVKRLQKERDEALRQMVEAQRVRDEETRKVDKLRADREQAISTLARWKQEVQGKWIEETNKFRAHITLTLKERQEAEEKFKAANEAAIKAHSNETTARRVVAELQKQTRETTEQLAVAMTARENAEAIASILCSEKKELEQTLVRANGRLEDQQKSLERYEEQINSVAKQDGRVWRAPLLCRPPEFIPLTERRGKKPTIISLLNLKGGVGKTTITANLGGYLAAHRGKRVLLIDLDHQRSLTQLLLSTRHRKDAAKARRTAQDFFLSTRSARDLYAAAEKIPGIESCSLITNSDAEPGYGTQKNLDDVEMELLGQWLINPREIDIRFLLRPALHSELVQTTFDYVLIDCPPRLTTACINGLTASDYVLIPAQAEPISARSVPHLLRRLKELRDGDIIPELKVLGIVANMVAPNADDGTSTEGKVLRDTEALAKSVWGKPVCVFRAKIRDSNHYATCASKVEEALSLPGVDKSLVIKQYESLMNDIDKRMEEQINESLYTARVSS